MFGPSPEIRRAQIELEKILERIGGPEIDPDLAIQTDAIVKKREDAKESARIFANLNRLRRRDAEKTKEGFGGRHHYS